MYLSRVELNPFRHETLRALTSPQVMHASIMAGYPSFEKTENRVLWRIDRIGPSTYVLVQSRTKPDFHHMVDQYGWPEANQKWDTLEYDKFLSKVSDGQEWRFRLTANPVRSIRDSENGKRGKVKAHVTVEQQKKWLLDRCIRLGFIIPKTGADEYALDVKSRETKTFFREKKEITVSFATFEGILVVEDAATLRETLSKGIGRAKAYGCGLMTLAKT